MSKIKLVIIGGGAITEEVYLPILSDDSPFELVSLVERDSATADQLRQKFQLDSVVATIEAVENSFEAAIVATPNYTHKDITLTLLNSKIHTLVEKPMALSKADCEEMITASEQMKTALMVGMVRRYYDNMQTVKKLIDTKSLGKIKRVLFNEGYVFNWPVKSDSLVNIHKAGGGVLMDIGVHIFDLLIYWLGMPKVEDYYDDSPLRIEAECLANLSWSNGTLATIQISRLRSLSNKVKLVFELGDVEFEVRQSEKIAIRLANEIDVLGNVPKLSTDRLNPFRLQLLDFAASIKGYSDSRSSLTDARNGISLIQDCYRHKKNLSLRYHYF